MIYFIQHLQVYCPELKVKSSKNSQSPYVKLHLPNHWSVKEGKQYHQLR